MIIFFLISEATIGVMAFALLVVIYALGVVIGDYFSYIVFYIFFIFVALELIPMLCFESDFTDWDKPFPFLGLIFRWISIWILPFVAALYVKFSIVNKYEFFEESAFPISPKLHFEIILIYIVAVLVTFLLGRVNSFIPAFWIILLVILPKSKYDIAEYIAKREVIAPIEYEVRKTSEIVSATRMNTKKYVGYIDSDGEEEKISRENVKVHKYISRYDLLQENGKDKYSLLSYKGSEEVDEKEFSSYTNISEATILSVEDFSEGVAWVNTRELGWCVIDTDGTILFVMPDGHTRPLSKFCNGISYIDHNSLINKSGDIVWSLDKEGKAYADEQWGENVIDMETFTPYYKEYHFWGKLFVEYKIESFDYTGSFWGIVDESGNWYYEPKPSEGQGMWFRSDVVLITPDQMINIDTNERFPFTEDDINSEIEDLWDLHYKMKTHPENLYYCFDGFENIDGDKVIDLSEYNSITNYPEFVDGYAILDSRNDGGTQYYTVINTMGHRMFEPRPYEEHSDISEGTFHIGSKYYDVSGNLLFDLYEKGITDSGDFHCGYACGKSSIGVVYFNKRGEIVFQRNK